jgi:hypothetical protein
LWGGEIGVLRRERGGRKIRSCYRESVTAVSEDFCRRGHRRRSCLRGHGSIKTFTVRTNGASSIGTSFSSAPVACQDCRRRHRTAAPIRQQATTLRHPSGHARHGEHEPSRAQGSTCPPPVRV